MKPISEMWYQLRKLGIHRVEFSYYGGGDSGSIDQPHLYDENNNSLPNSVLEDVRIGWKTSRQKWNGTAWAATEMVEPTLVLDVMAEIAEDKLCDHFGGWEINEGSFGSITFWVESFKVYVVNTAYVEVATGEEDEYGDQMYETEEGETDSVTLDLSPNAVEQMVIETAFDEEEE